MGSNQGEQSGKSRNSCEGDGAGGSAGECEVEAKRAQKDREAVLSPVVLALQRLYTYNIVRKWARCGMRLESASKKDFESVNKMVRDMKRVAVLKKLLRRISVMTREHARKCPVASRVTSVNARVFSAAYVIFVHPDKVFKAQGEAVEAVKKAAQAIIGEFENVCNAVMKQHPVQRPATKFLRSAKTGSVKREESTEQEQLVQQVWREASDPMDLGQYQEAIAGAKLFPTRLAEFAKAFQDWKLEDERNWMGLFGKAVNELYTAERSLDEEDAKTPQLRKKYELEEAQLREKAGMILREDILAEFKRTFPADWSWLKRDAGRGEEGRARGSAMEIDDMPSFFPVVIGKEQLTHEINLNPKFRYSPMVAMNTSWEDASVVLRRDACEEVFWTSLMKELAQKPPSYVRTIKVLGVVRQVFEDLGHDGGGQMGWKEGLAIVDVLGTTVIQRIRESQSVDWGVFHQMVIDIQTPLQAYKFEDGNKSVQEPSYVGVCVPTSRTWRHIDNGMVAAAADSCKRPAAFAASLEFLVAQAKMVRADVLSARLLKIIPVMVEYGIMHEKSIFAQRVTDKEIELEKTREWLRTTIRTDLSQARLFVKDMTSGDQLTKHLEEQPDTLVPCFLGVVKDAVFNMVTAPKPVKNAKYPETLLLDIARINKFNSNLSLYAATATVLVTITSSLRKLRKENPAEILEAVVAKIFQDSRVTSVDVPGLISVSMKTLEKMTTMSDDGRKTLKGELEQHLGRTDGVLGLMTSRLSNFMLHSLKGEDVDIYKDDATTKVAFLHPPP